MTPEPGAPQPGAPGRLRVAVMQPYFAPYAGYYRLLAAVDIFVLFDCVQFPRRGWVHRNRLPDAAGEPAWLTLPLKPAPFEAPIAEMGFAEDAAARMAERVRAFPSLAIPPTAAQAFLHAAPFEGPLVDYLERQIEAARALFGFGCRLLRSSRLDIDPALRGQARVLEIVARLTATDYVNAPGGRDLYDTQVFADRGVALHFLSPYEGSPFSLLHRLATEPAQTMAADIRAQTPAFC